MHINDLHNLYGLISQSMNWYTTYYTSYFRIYVICFTAYEMVQLCFEITSITICFFSLVIAHTEFEKFRRIYYTHNDQPRSQALPTNVEGAWYILSRA